MINMVGYFVRYVGHKKDLGIANINRLDVLCVAQKWTEYGRGLNDGKVH